MMLGLDGAETFVSGHVEGIEASQYHDWRFLATGREVMGWAMSNDRAYTVVTLDGPGSYWQTNVSFSCHVPAGMAVPQ